MADNATAAELRNLDHDQLVERLAEYKEELFNLRFQAATGQLESHGRLRALRKDIARVYTVLTEREYAGVAGNEALVPEGDEAASGASAVATKPRRGLRKSKAEKA